MRSWIVVAAVTVSCGKSSAPPPRAIGTDATAAPLDAAMVVDAAADAPGPRSAGDAEVEAARRLVDAWVAAQNDGAFDRYQALYGEPFSGVRRSGEQVRRFDRAGWMRDRRVMFRRPMVVEVDDLVVYVAGPLRQVFFTQQWSQGTYRDVGTKNLVLSGDGDATRIVYEEMLGSRIVGAVEPPGVGAAAPTTVAGDGTTWYGLDRAPSLAAMRLAPLDGTTAMIAGTGRALPAIDLVVVDSVRDAATGTLGGGTVSGALAADDPLQALAGQAVVVLDESLREVCRGTLGPPTVQVAGYVDEGPSDVAELAPRLWRGGTPIVFASVTAPCTGGFVRGVDAVGPTAVVDADQLTERKAKPARARLAGDGVTVELAAAIDDGGHGFVLWNLTRDESCAAPELHERVLFAATARGASWTFTQVARLEGNDAHLVVADLDDDGALDAVVTGGVYRSGRFALWWPSLFIPWPAGLGCDGDGGE